MAKTQEMTYGRPFPLIIKFALPLIAGNILQQTYSLVDAAIVGKNLDIQ
ncbi:MAG: MATE family efflux transporter, partial [Bacteroidales bacterium]|nr:MATE family efflux transporter [Bacteroidales bacterium]